MYKNTIQNKITWLFILLFSLAFGLTFTLVSFTHRNHLIESIDEQITIGRNIFFQAVQNKVVSVDFAITKLLLEQTLESSLQATDPAHLQQLLKKTRQEIGAELLIIKKLDDTLIINDSDNQEINLYHAILKELSTHTLPTNEYSFVLLDGALYLLISSSASSYQWISAGFHVDKQFVQMIHNLSSLDIVFAQNTPDDQENRFIISNLDKRPFPIKSSLLAESPQTLTSKNSGEINYRVSFTQLQGFPSETYLGLLAPLNKTQEIMQNLLVKLSIVFLTCLIMSIIGTYFLAKNITKPLKSFVKRAKKVVVDEKFTPIEVQGENEITALAAEFNQMFETIKKRENAINYHAFYDELTGLPNRVLFLDSLTNALRLAKHHQQQITAIVMDLNRFKEINDTLGHHNGDKLLKLVAKRLEKRFAKTDLIARLGGDEFGLLLIDHPLDKSRQFVQELSRAFNKSFSIAGMSLDIATSIGIAIYPTHAKDANDILQKADIAMYRAKDSNKAYEFYHQEHDKHSLLRLSMMNELKKAVYNDELILHYQPKVDLKSKTVRQVEALVRWIHPNHGVISPVQFIPLAEQTGHVRHLTKWALHTAIKQAYEWQVADIDIAVAINISAIDLLDASFARDIKKIVHDIPVETGRIILEITESVIMGDPKHSISILEELHEMGIQLSLDDFGTGHSTMAQLKKLPVDEVKIDQSFIRHLDLDKSDQIIVESTIELGHQLGLKVVGEGVTDQNILVTLEKMGCDYGQGHHICPPVSITELSQWLITSPFGIKNHGHH